VNPPSLVSPWDAAPYNGKEGIPFPTPTTNVAVATPFGSGALYDPNTKGPNTWQWSFTVERSLTQNLVVRAGYVGVRGIHMQDGQVKNLAVYIPGASTAANQQQRRPIVIAEVDLGREHRHEREDEQRPPGGGEHLDRRDVRQPVVVVVVSGLVSGVLIGSCC
jgi:hypothetical protein